MSTVTVVAAGLNRLSTMLTCADRSPCETLLILKAQVRMIMVIQQRLEKAIAKIKPGFVGPVLTCMPQQFEFS